MSAFVLFYDAIGRYRCDMVHRRSSRRKRLATMAAAQKSSAASSPWRIVMASKEPERLEDLGQEMMRLRRRHWHRSLMIRPRRDARRGTSQRGADHLSLVPTTSSSQRRTGQEERRQPSTCSHSATSESPRCYEHGLRVPNAMSVAGFDDMPYAAWMTPPLTTIRQPLLEMGRVATTMVLRLIGGEALDDIRVELSTPLIKRASCAPPRPSC